MRTLPRARKDRKFDFTLDTSTTSFPPFCRKREKETEKREREKESAGGGGVGREREVGVGGIVNGCPPFPSPPHTHTLREKLKLSDVYAPLV